MKKILLVAVVFALFTTAASAQRGHVTQHHRIQQGFHDGQLTRGEKFRLHKNEARYRHERRKAFRDGKLTRTEKRRLNHLRRHDSRRIYAMKHNTHRRVF